MLVTMHVFIHSFSFSPFFSGRTNHPHIRYKHALIKLIKAFSGCKITYIGDARTFFMCFVGALRNGSHFVN